MEHFSEAWDSSTLLLMVLAIWINAQIIILTSWTKMMLCSLTTDVSLSPSLFLAFKANGEKRGKNLPMSRACLLDILFAPWLDRRASVLWVCTPPNVYMRNHNCTEWEGKHTRLGCKIGALLASVVILELLNASLSLAPHLAGRTFSTVPCFCFLMMSRVGSGWAEAQRANSWWDVHWPVEDLKPGTDVPLSMTIWGGLRSYSQT